MRNAFRVFKRDLLRLFKAPAALVVVVALIVLPSLYTWFNVVGFFNPYENTGNLRVCVVNEDKGANSDITGEIKVGDQIVESLQENDQLGWVFTDRDTAMEEIYSGKSYAAFVIPEDFSEDITTLFTGDFIQPELEYYVNEKAGAVSPKITDTGATTLEQTINSTFVSTVSSTVTELMEEKTAETDAAVNATKDSVAANFAKMKNSVSQASNSFSQLSTASSDATTKVAESKQLLQEVKESNKQVSEQLTEASKTVAELQAELGPMIADLSSTLDDASASVSSISSKTSAALSEIAKTIDEAEPTVDAAIDMCDSVIAMNEAAITYLEGLKDDPLLSPDEAAQIDNAIAALTQQNADLKDVRDRLEANYDTIKANADAVAQAHAELDASLQTYLTDVGEKRRYFFSVLVPTIELTLAQMNDAIATLQSALDTQNLLIDQSFVVFDQLSDTLITTSSALSETSSLLSSVYTSLDTLQTDLTALSTSGELEQFLKKDNLEVKKVADFMLAPAQIKTESLYNLTAYGSAMAPLFTNLSLWIGVFMLMVIMKIEVDSEGFEELSVNERFLGRWLLFAPMVMLQAIVCITGNIFLGVQTASIPLCYLTAVLTSLTYLTIQYMLSTTLQHVGKGLCVILVFLQIPGATGLYPIEMMPEFFRAIYPLFPFTYGINALRETIAGFYEYHWAMDCAMLLVFTTGAALIGLLVRPYLTNINRLFAKQIKQAGVLNAEEYQLPARRFRMDELFGVLADREEFKYQISVRAHSFMRKYAKRRRIAIILGVAVPTILTLIFSVAESEKVVVLTMWLICLILTGSFFIGLEYAKEKIQHQLSLGHLDEEEIHALYAERDGLDHHEDIHPAGQGRLHPARKIQRRIRKR